MDQKEPDTDLDTFPKLLASHVKLRPTRDAIREKDLGIWQSWTWAEAAAEIRALACGLTTLGLQRGVKLAIIGDNRPRLYWGMTAAQALGAIPVPLYQDAVADEMAYVLDNADVKIALVEDQEQVDKMLEIRDRCPRLEHIIFDDTRGLGHYEQDFLHEILGALFGEVLIEMQAQQVVDIMRFQVGDFFPKPGQPLGCLVGREILDRLRFENNHHGRQGGLGSDPL